MKEIVLLVFFLSIGQGLDSASSSISTTPTCEVPKPLFSQGLRPARKRGRLLQYECMRGYKLVGSKYIRCVNSKYDSSPPICARRGCEIPPKPENSILLSEYHQSVLRMECNEGYVVAGQKLSICTGRNWTFPLGTCRETNKTFQTSCDFESEDLCGWTHDVDAEFNWKRMTRTTQNPLRTGPKHDHTTNQTGNGYFMLVESRGQELSNRARLISPLYNSFHSVSACLRLWYFMHGAAVETLTIHMKTESTEMDDIIDTSNFVLWNVTHESFDGWKEAFAHIPFTEESFQIIIEAVSSGNHLGDIAIDDFEMFNCTKDKTESATEIDSETSGSTENVLISDFESCSNRCNETIPSKKKYSMSANEYISECDCHMGCMNSNTCCPDFETKCLEESSTSQEAEEVTKPITSTTITTTTTTTSTTAIPTTKPTTTTTTTSTTVKPTIAFTTTRKPTTNTPTITTKSTRKTTRSTTTTLVPSYPIFDDKDFQSSVTDDDEIYELSVWQILLWATVCALVFFSIIFLAINFYRNKYKKFQNDEGPNSTARRGSGSDNSNQLSIRFNTREEHLDFRTSLDQEPEVKPPTPDTREVSDAEGEESEERKKPYGKLSFPKNRKYSVL